MANYHLYYVLGVMYVLGVICQRWKAENKLCIFKVFLSAKNTLGIFHIKSFHYVSQKHIISAEWLF